ncbi:MAG: cytochrome c3 family protein [candidate division Zixibacteria bacterium]|jgi:hypothetical protein|nr:cytochrome c3 family protein [candidate division Zixibacteria bacterium]
MSGDGHIGRKALTLTILVLLCAVVGGYGYLATGPTEDSGRIFLANSGGAVMFEHRNHTALVDNCANCHHDKLTASLSNQCGDCHDDGLAADEFSHADLIEIHLSECTICHGVSDTSVNTSCRECHPKVQESELGLTACSECHDDGYSGDMIDHDDMVAIEGHTCNSCHIPRSVSDVYHEQCNHCHEHHDRARFVEADGNARCNICHLK